MAWGPGKYDDLATTAREAAAAQAVLLLIIAGNRGSGFSVQMTYPGLPPHQIVTLLRDIALQIETDGGAG